MLKFAGIQNCGVFNSICHTRRQGEKQQINYYDGFSAHLKNFKQLKYPLTGVCEKFVKKLMLPYKYTPMRIAQIVYNFSNGRHIFQYALTPCFAVLLTTSSVRLLLQNVLICQTHN
jgi:hypothetical protein